jgi:hypothetical protein
MAAGFTPPPRYLWPKEFPPLSLEQQVINDDWMRHWHEVSPTRYGAIEHFNHTPVRTRLRRLAAARSRPVRGLASINGEPLTGKNIIALKCGTTWPRLSRNGFQGSL